MYTDRHIQYLNLPPVPEELLARLPNSIDEYHCKSVYTTYHWSDSFNCDLDQWCKQNICSDMYFAFQLITGNLVIHKDTPTITKLNYIVIPGGQNVVTTFYDNNKKEIAKYKIEPAKWHILKADTFHSVDGIEENNLRLSITAKIF